MKRTIIYLPLIVLVLISCQSNYKNKPEDLNMTKVAVTKTMDNYYAAVHARDLKTMNALWADDILYCGTDPKEFWNKASLDKVFTDEFADSAAMPDFKVDTREIRLDKDGQSALVLEQMKIDKFSTKIPFRMIFHLVRINNDWQIDFVSAGLIPLNEDFDKMNKALM